MNITIAGGSGFLGQALTNYFEEKAHKVLILSRNPSNKNEIHWNGSYHSDWVDEISDTDVLINLCGKSVDCRYNARNKKAIIESRTESTLALHKAISKRKIAPKIWLNASSATIYVHAETQMMNEKDGVIGDDFSMNVCKKWEGTFFGENHSEVRQVALRTSIVLGKSGGAFSKLKPLARLGMGGSQGNGQQMVSWIHINDFCNAVDFIINTHGIVGPINITSPNPLSNEAFMKALCSEMKISLRISQPAWLLEIGAALIGTETELLLKSRFVHPDKLLHHGFYFENGMIEECFKALCK